MAEFFEAASRAFDVDEEVAVFYAKYPGSAST